MTRFAKSSKALVAASVFTFVTMAAPASAVPTLYVLVNACPNGAALNAAISAEANADPANGQATSDSHVAAAEQFAICAERGPDDFVRSVSKLLFYVRMQNSHVTLRQEDENDPDLYSGVRALRDHMRSEKQQTYEPYVRAATSLMGTLDNAYLTAERRLYSRSPESLSQRP